MADEDLAIAMGVCVATLENWKAQHPEFLESVTAGKREHDDQVVGSSLLLACQAYYYQYEKWDPTRKNGDGTTGAIVRLWGVHHPDPRAIALYMHNRHGWRFPGQAGPVVANDTPPGLPPGAEPEPEPDAEQLAQLGELARATMAERYGTRIRVPSQEVEAAAAAAEPEKQQLTEPNENEHDKEKK
jgi:hypothetical protein